MSNLSSHAHAAKLIRKEIKEALPGLKASVRSSSYAGGNSIRVEVEDQHPSVIKVLEKIVSKYQYGHFDGMYDIYEYSNRREDIPQVKFTFVENPMSDALRIELNKYIEKTYADPTEYSLAHRIYSDAESEFWINRQ